MLHVALGRLGREGPVLVEGAVAADDPVWDQTGLAWVVPANVILQVSQAGSGEIVVRGKVRGTLRHACRRCLRPVDTEVDEDLAMVFVGSDESEGDAGVETYVYDPFKKALDLKDAVREELVLAIDPYVVCDPRCKGLCPKCGVSLQEETCACSEDEPDPRWDALRSLKNR